MNDRVKKLTEYTYTIDDTYTFRIDPGDQILAYRSVKGCEYVDVLADIEILPTPDDIEGQLLRIVDAYKPQNNLVSLLGSMADNAGWDADSIAVFVD